MKECREKIVEAAGKLFPGQFEKSVRETMQLSEKRSGKIVEGFLKAFEEVMGQASCKAEEDRDDKAGYLLFSCLHSSIFLKKYLIRIDLMGQGFYHDEPLGTSYWDAGDIYRFFERDIKEIRRKLVEKNPRIRGYELDGIRYAYAPYYHRIAKAFVREMLEEMLGGMKEDGQEDSEAEKQVRILFGEYMGEADLLFIVGRERLNAVFQDLCG